MYCPDEIRQLSLEDDDVRLHVPCPRHGERSSMEMYDGVRVVLKHGRERALAGGRDQDHRGSAGESHDVSVAPLHQAGQRLRVSTCRDLSRDGDLSCHQSRRVGVPLIVH